MLRIQNKRSSRSAIRNTNPDTSRLSKNKQKLVSFDIISIVLGRYFIYILYLCIFIRRKLILECVLWKTNVAVSHILQNPKALSTRLVYDTRLNGNYDEQFITR